ncbi:MAG: hypothetical protein R6X22_03475 [Gemmatimonadota bacterium]
MNLAARLFLEALRFDLEPEDVVRRRADRALARGVGGFVVFGGDAVLVARRIEEWRGAVRHRLWVASDLERGPGQQFRGLPELPPPAGLAASPDPEAARGPSAWTSCSPPSSTSTSSRAIRSSARAASARIRSG